MSTEINIKDLIKDNTVAFERLRHNVAYYRINDFTFPVPLEDVGDATLHSTEKAIMFMRYIRKAIKENTFQPV